MGVQEQEHLWGGETTKAVDNFPVSGETVPVPVVHWLARIKGASARVNAPDRSMIADPACAAVSQCLRVSSALPVKKVKSVWANEAGVIC